MGEVKQPAPALLAMSEPDLSAEIAQRIERRERLAALAGKLGADAPGAGALAEMLDEATEDLAEVCLVGVRRMDAYAAVAAVFGEALLDDEGG